MCGIRSRSGADRGDARCLGNTGHRRDRRPRHSPRAGIAGGIGRGGGAGRLGETQSSPVGTLSFDNLERRLREGNCNLLALDETIASIEALDYDEMYDDLRDSLNDIADAQWMLIQFGMSDSYTAGTLKQSYQSLRATFDSLKDGELQQDNADIVLQLRNAQDQIVKAAESLYVALLEMDINRGTLDRSLTALDRSIQEMELRYELGQISALTLDQVKAGAPLCSAVRPRWI